MNKYIFFSFLFFICWMHTYSQNIVKRNPLKSKEEANFYWSSDYTLFDFTTDEPIFPILKDGQLIYRIHYASKEDPRPYSGEFNINQLEKLRFLKFKNRESCIKFCLTLKPPLIPKIITLPVNEIFDSVAQSGGNILSDGGSPIISRGITWSTSPNPNIFLQTKTSNGTGIGIFKSSLTKLKPNTIYFVRAFATNSAGTGYGNEISFTSKPEIFACGSSKVSDIDGNIYHTVQIGMQCWTKENLKVSKYNDGTPVPLDNSGGIPGTGPDETWSFKASGARTIYAHSQENFSAYGYLYNWFAARGIASAGDTNYKNLCPIGWHIPTVEEGFTLSNFLGGYIIAGGKLKSTGTTQWISPNISATNLSGFSGLPGGSRINYIGRFESLGSKGFWWFSSGVPDRVDGMSLSFDESSVGLFAGNTEENGHSVRCLKDTLTISMTLTIPSLTTIEADSIKTTSIRSGGNISSDGGCSLTDRGLVWDTSPNPTIVLSTKTWNGLGIGRFTSEITGLNPNTTYYIRAYASNCRGIAYGNEVSFTTASALTVPTLTTTAADSIKPTTARSGGNITSDGGCAITARGLVWSTSQNPTISLSTKTSDGTGAGIFSSNLTSLIANTTYYIRAYATNCAGTAYGSEVSFTTTAATTLPTLTTTAADSIKTTTARSGGNITSDGGCTITARGVVWFTSQNPTISLSTKTSEGTGTGSFTSNLTGLTANTTYYVRAYATNCAGTAYGNQLSFTTTAVSQGVPCPGVPTVMDIDGNTYNTVQIGEQCWTKENLKVTKYSDGMIIPLDSSGGIALNGAGQTWRSRTTGARTIYAHSPSNLSTYGYLYNWYAVKGIAISGSTSFKNLCPKGWHVPSDGEWTALTTFLGGESIAGGKMKSTGTTLWQSPNTGATNESGFSAYPAGYRFYTGSFNDVSYNLLFWSASDFLSTTVIDDDFTAWFRGLYYTSGDVSRLHNDKSIGGSVRCLKDTFTTPSTKIPTLTTTAADSIKTTTARSGGNITTDGGCSITARGVVWSTSQNPTIVLSTKTSDGTGTGSFTSNLTGLTANTTYYVRAYATNCSGTAYGNQLTFTTTASQGVPCPGASTVKDIDGNTYNTVQIGEQCWTKENLRVTKYSDGTSIPLDSSGGTAGNGLGQTWGSRTTGARTIYEHSASNLTTYGYLYNWYAAKGIATTGSTSFKNLCPTGWHVPSDGEWTNLTTYLGGESLAGGKMKSTGTTLWASPNTEATNESGFTVLPGGSRSSEGSFGSIRFYPFFWSATENDSGTAWYRGLFNSSGGVGRYGSYVEQGGFSVRCLKDSLSTPSTTLPTLTTTAADSIKSTTARSGGNISSDGGCTITARGVVWTTSQNPTISLSTKTSEGTGTGSFSSNLTGLTANTTYYVRAYATNCAGTAYGNQLTFTTTTASQGVPCPGVPTVSDIDGNTYNTVQIGTQCWTKENLRVTKFSDGTIIPLDSSGGNAGNGAGQTWGSRTAGARTIYAHSPSNLSTYGYLYNWYAAFDIKGLCPTGWHVPSDSEWIKTENFLGGSIAANNKMKEKGSNYWLGTNVDVTNESGFTSLPGGYRHPTGSGSAIGFDFLGRRTWYWSSSGYFSLTEGNLGTSLNNNIDGLSFESGSIKRLGVSVRCLKDTFSTPSSTVPTLTTTTLDSIKTTTARSGGNITADGGCTITARGVVWSTSQNPTISLSTKTSEGTGTGSFTSNLTGLTANTKYYVRAYATNCAGTAYGNQLTFTTTAASQGVPCPGASTIKDIDGNTYNTVQIGTQCWTKENLRVTKYSDGTIIPLDSSGGTAGNGAGQTWGSRTTGARTIYAHSQSNLTTYGYLYNWYAAKGIATTGSTIYKNLCPAGWHVPSDGEWTILTTHLGGVMVAGGKMKSTGTTLWTSPNTGATNESGLTALPGGFRINNGIFSITKEYTFFWSATEGDANSAWYRGLNYNSGVVTRNFINMNGNYKSVGASVRCLKDTVTNPSTKIPTLTTAVVDSIKTTTARSGGNITNDGGCTITARGVVWSTSQNPTIALSTKTSDGTGTGSFISNLKGLIANTTYYVRAYAINCAGTAYGNQLSFTTTAVSQGVPCPGVPTVTDIDGNTYNTVQIGTQCWTKENLRVTKYSDGTIIPLDSSGGNAGNGAGQTWRIWTTGARTIYAHSPSNLSTYGYLYNWYAAKGIASTGSTSYKNLCPTGWHVPSDGEWTTLTTHIGGVYVAGGKMKSTGTNLWTSPNTGATNESGFTGLPGGNRYPGGSFVEIRNDASFCSATEDADGNVWNRNLFSNSGHVSRGQWYFKSIGGSVRCLRD